MDLEPDFEMHIIGGDLFDRVPSMDELTLYFDFVILCTIELCQGRWRAISSQEVLSYIDSFPALTNLDLSV